MGRRGFTLIELLVVIAIIAVLMGILMPAKNFERWLYQRDREDARTRPIVKTSQPIPM